MFNFNCFILDFFDIFLIISSIKTEIGHIAAAIYDFVINSAVLRWFRRNFLL